MTSALAASQHAFLDRDRYPRYPVTVDQYRCFRRDGLLVVRNLVSPDDIAELRQHTEDLMQGRLPEQSDEMDVRDVADDLHSTRQKLERPPAHLSPLEKTQYFLRIHMLHRKLEIHERYLLHPRVLDVLEVLIGPDVLALQTMLFLKPPGKPGQGWHQDSYYIPTHPDTLCGAWIAIDDCDEQNGAMWFAKGSAHEPVFPPCPDVKYGFGDRMLCDITHVKGVSNPDDQQNTLARIADDYDQILVGAKAGDVVFFNGHILHRSKQNWSNDRFRRAFVGHYCNARSFTQWGSHWGGAQDPATRMTNASHILARGDTHLPFAQPQFGTPCAAVLSPQERSRASEYAATMIGNANNGLMGCGIGDPSLADHHDDDKTPDAGGY